MLTESERVPAHLILIANRLVWIEAEDEAEKFAEDDSTLVRWIRESGIWNEVTEALASEAFSALLRKPVGAAAEGVLIEPSESRIAVLLCLNAILFGWDVYLFLVSAK